MAGNGSIADVVMADEDEDPVVAELDVYLSLTLKNKLVLCQYPVRPSNKPYFQPGDNVEARVKPKHQEYELKFPLDVTSNHYDEVAGDDIASKANGDEPQSRQLFPGKQFDYRVLKSKAVSDVSRYCVGALKDGELHLTPLHSIVQMKPSFDYIDENLKREKAAQEKKAKLTEEPTPVKVTFHRRETERAAAARMRSHAYLQAQRAEEPWVRAQYIHHKDKASQQEGQQLLCNKKDKKINFRLSPSEYLKTLRPKEDQPMATDTKPQPIRSLDDILRVPQIAARVKHVLLLAGCVRYADICRLLSVDQTIEAEVFAALKQYAWLIHGCWVIKSEFMYTKGAKSPWTNVSADRLVFGRNVALLELAGSEPLKRSELLKMTHLEEPDLKDILDQLAVLIRGAGWKLKFDKDEEFIQGYRDVVQEQHKLWDEFSRSVRSQVVPKDAAPSRGRSGPGRSKSRPAKMARKSPAASEPADCVGIVKAMLAQNGVASLQQLCERVCGDGPQTPNTASEVINALEQIGVYEFKCEGLTDRLFAVEKAGAEDQNKYRMVVLKLFNEKKKVRKADVTDAFKSEGLSEPPSSLYSKLMKEFAISKSNQWILKLT